MTHEALDACRIPHRLHVAEDGAEAIAFLYREGEFSHAPTPGLILLDLAIPKADGHDVLTEIKTNRRLAHIPVVILTGSRAEKDIDKSYRLNADCYITKPAGLEAFIAEMRFVASLLGRH